MGLSLANISLVAPSSPLLTAASEFYVDLLGFRIISQTTETTWLHLFAYQPMDACIRLSNTVSVADLTAKQSQIQSELVKGTIPSTPSVLPVFFMEDLTTLEQALTRKNVLFVKSKGEKTEMLYFCDPLANLIQVTNERPASSPSAPQAPNEESMASQINLLREDKVLATSWTCLANPKRNIGFLTSGGDSAGMNAAVRAIARYALYKHCQPYAIFEGYNGLVSGGDKIKKLGWEDVRGLLSLGGTVIGTARSKAFRTREGRLQAAANMIKSGIDALIVIGGDGSLTGADILRQEWSGLVKELSETGQISSEQANSVQAHLTIVGMVGSIDNDMCMTDVTIGAVTSLHRICESLDCLTSTAMSHQRAFIVEVMGRHCGWLALMAAIAVGADWVFLPERPPPLNPDCKTDWETEMCDALQKQRAMGNRASIVVLCEGAIDSNLKPIKSEYLKTILETKLGLDTRVTTLGHIQRGGTPCAYDRYLATMQGIDAVDAVLESTPSTVSPMIGISQNKITRIPLMDAVKLTLSVSESIKQKDFKTAMELRDPDFASCYNAYIESTIFADGPGTRVLPETQRIRVGIINVGAPAGGMNAAVRVATRLCLNRGHVPLGIHNGFSGLVQDEVAPLTWQDVAKWQSKGGSELGTNRDHPAKAEEDGLRSKSISQFIDLGQIAFHMQKHNIQALLIIGGYEGYTSMLTLTKARKTYPAFCIPMVHLPATVSNNVPGTEYSVGSDTALNVIVEACDRIKLSANASRKRVFVVEVQGGNCGYLAVMGGLTVGAATVYIPETGINIHVLQKDIRHLCRRYEEDDRSKIPAEGRLILRNEMAGGDVYTTSVISNILKEEGHGSFDSRTSILGHLQQGGTPSPLDRIRATRMAVACVDWLQEIAFESRNKMTGQVYTQNMEHSTVLCIRGSKTVFAPVEHVKDYNDNSWWLGYSKMINVLAKYDYFENKA